ncbi:MAG: FAD-dependent oxidoreductase [Ruminococcaceae bacterium]|nr:FAD-dependent oxidoreductase [Oscillospiraceae bacterium]
MKKYDLTVAGGGFAGVAAAVAAAREGCSVLLLEKGNSLGGAAVNCLVNPFMRNNTELNGVNTELSQGLFEEIKERLIERDALVNGRIFLEEELKFVFNDMVREANIDVLFRAYISSVDKKDGKISNIRVSTISGYVDIESDYYIDATGDAQVAYLAGCPTILGREPDHLCQPMTLCFRVGNVDVERFFEGKERLVELYKDARANGDVTNPREDILVFRTPIHNVLHFNTTRVVKLDPTSVFDVSKAELIARDQVREIYDFMKKHAEGLEDSFLMMTAPEIGVRESRMIVGDYVLTEQDCRNFTKFEDGIATCNYDIDIHNPEGSGTSHYYFPKGEYYTIPYRSLIPQSVSNMLVAGRCISSDHGAQASYRIMPTVCTIGEAAGTAVALAKISACDVRNISITDLQSTLRKHGAFIG